MGLDMYLKARLYVSGFKHNGEESRKRMEKILRAAGFPKGLVTEDSPSVEVEVTVAYWRKANAIHRWFVEKVQDGKDECQDSYVARDQLIELRDTCKRALATAKVAEGQPVHSGTTYHGISSEKAGQVEEHFDLGRAALNGEELAGILPTQAGFFFGSTDYDEWYLQDLEDTVKQIDNVLALTPEGIDFEYHASW